MLGTTIGSYRVIERLGAGGMGEVFLAEHTTLHKKAALKRLPDDLLSAPGARERLWHEARSAARLGHPNIATTFDVIESSGGPVIVMEYVPGETLASKLRQGSLPVSRALEIARDIAAGLEAAHEEGIIHRDLKPANVQITPRGDVKILDFGVAKSIVPNASNPAAGTGLTGTAHVVGTLEYMSPEQLAAGAVDARSDIYSLGVVLFEMLAGRRPYQASDYLGTVMAVMSGSTPDLTALNRAVPPNVAAIVKRAMAREASERFPSAADLRHELSRALDDLSNAVTRPDVEPFAGRATVGTEEGSTAPGMRRLWRHPVTIGSIVILVLAAALFLGLKSPQPPNRLEPIVGVVPFTNASGDPNNDYLALGMSDGLTNRLSSLPGLRVLPPGTSAPKSGQVDPARSVRDLGASFVVAGSVERVGDALAVTVALVGRNGAGRHIATYKGSVSQLFELHRRAAQGVSQALSAEGLIPPGTTASDEQPTSNPDAYAEYLQGRAFLERSDVKGNVEHAIALFTGAIAKDSRFALAHAALGDAYLAQYRETKVPDWTDRATKAVLEAVRLDPRRPQIRMSLATLYLQLGQSEKAEEELRAVMALEPQNDDARRTLAAIHRRAAEFDDAVAEGIKARDLRPNYWLNHFELGNTFYIAGRFEEAAAAYLRVTELQPDNARGFLNLGASQHATGDIQRALDNYRRANSIEPRATAFSNIGVILHWQGDYAGAVSNYERAVALPPNEPQLFANLGDALVKLGQQERARASYRKAVDLATNLLTVNSEDAATLAGRATYHAKLGRHADAGADIEKALNLSKDDGQVLYSLAVVHALAGRPDRSCEALAQALAHGASKVEARNADEFQVLKDCAAYRSLRNE